MLIARSLYGKPISGSRLVAGLLSSGESVIRSLFNTCTQGCWYDPSDFSTMFQDAAGTVPVTAAGQPVGKILDKSGKGNHLTQAVEANRPTLVVDTLGYYRLSYDGVNDLESATIDFSASDKLTIAATFKTAVASDYSVMSFGSVTTEAGTFDFGTYLGGAILYRSGAAPFGARATASFGASTITTLATCNLGGATQATENPTLRVDGAQFDLTDYGSGDTGGGNFGEYTFKLGGGITQLDGYIYGAMCFDRILSESEIAVVEAYLKNKSGSFYPAFYSDSAVFTPETTYHYGSTFSHVDVLTSATDFIVGISSPVYDYYPDYAAIGVYVNGSFNQQIDATISSMNEYYVSLPAGSKTVSFVHGLQTSNSGIKGSFVTSIRANQSMAQIGGQVSDCLLFYGDSITAGSDASPITQNAYALIVRYYIDLFLDSTPPLAVEAWGGRSLYDDCVDGTARAAFVAKIAAYNPTKFCMCIGTNDYGLNLWTAANFETAYAALLDDLHTALPDLQVYCVSPILRSVETANGLGSTLGDYRTAISTAVSTRTAFCEFVDGTTLVAIEDIPDGVHPDNAGHLFYAGGLLTAVFT